MYQRPLVLTMAVTVLVLFHFPPAFGIPVSKGSVSASVFHSPERTAGEGDFGEDNLTIQTAIRLWSQASPDPFARHSSLSFLGKYTRQDLDVAAESDTLDINQARVGISGVTLSRQNELYMIRLNGGFSEDVEVDERAELQLGGLALGTHVLSSSADLLVGGGYSYVFGQGLPLPALGARFEFANGWKLMALVPFFIHFSRSVSETGEASFFWRTSGQRTRTRIDGSSDSQALTHLEIQRMRVGGAFKQKFNGRGWSWGGQTGVEFLRRVTVEGGSSRPSEPGFFFSLAFQKDFGEIDVPEGSRVELYRELDSLIPLE